MKKAYTFTFLILFVIIGCKNNASSTKQANTEAKDSTQLKITGKGMETVTSDKEADDPKVYFKGIGTEPFWGVEIAESTITFTSLTEGYEKIVIPHVEPVLAADANVKLYRAEVESTAIRIEVIQGECSDQMSDTKYAYKVKVEVKKGADDEFKIFNGCGNYITDYRLHDIWVLEKMKGEMVNGNMFAKEVPNMEIYAKENRFSGYAGCNRMNGSLFFEKGLLRFVNVVTTEMACGPGNKENEFLKALQSSVRYSIENNRLTLSNDDGMLLVFKKVD